MGKKKKSILTPTMYLPGKEFLPKLVQGDTPTKDGIYMVYYEYNQAWSHTKEVAGATVAHYSKGKWGLNHRVFAYMGPIPQLAQEPLKEFKPPYILGQAFYIASLEQGAQRKYESGPHPQFIAAFLTPGRPGLFVFCLDSDNPEPYLVAKWTEKDPPSYKKLKPKALKKYNKMLDHLRRKNG